MAATFEEEGIRFQYPENWRLEREDTEEGWTVSLQSPGTAFLMLTLRTDAPTCDSMTEAALNALKEEYPELEAEEGVGSLAGQPAVGHDIQFFSLDLTNTCWTRVFYTSRGTVLVLCQTSDLDPGANEQVLRAICKSMEMDDE